MNDFNVNSKETGNTCNIHTELKQTSDLRRYVTLDNFETAFKAFLQQAEENAVSKIGNGGERPVGFEARNEYDNANLSTHYGRGAASKAPYMNWHVLSIYYIVESGSIVMGIEKSRYPHLNKMKFSRYKAIPGKEDVAVFFATIKEKLDYSMLHNKFLSIAEEIMALGME